jgi:hypothetical protein
MRSHFLSLLLFVRMFSSSCVFSQFPDFFYELPYFLKIDETDESEMIQNKNLILDTTDYSWTSKKRNVYEVDYRLYRWECELYCYIDTATSKLQGIKIWNTPENWESNGIKIGLNETDFLSFVKKLHLHYASYKCKYFNEYTIQTARLSYSFSFPSDNRINTYRECINETAQALHYVYVRSIQQKRKSKTVTATY